jgi:hypothetical protein
MPQCLQLHHKQDGRRGRRMIEIKYKNEELSGGNNQRQEIFLYSKAFTLALRCTQTPIQSTPMALLHR